MTPTQEACLEFCHARLNEEDEAARAVRTWGDPGPYDPIFAHLRRYLPDRTQVRTAGERVLLEAAPESAWALAKTWADHHDYDPAWEPQPDPEPEVA